MGKKTLREQYANLLRLRIAILDRMLEILNVRA